MSLAPLVRAVEEEHYKSDVPNLESGDTVRVHVRVVEGSRERVQVFEGIVIAMHGEGLNRSFTVRRMANNVGVERRFLEHSPRLDKIEVLRHGDVRRAKLYYLREKVGKRARIRERREPIGGGQMTRTRTAAEVAAEQAELAEVDAADDDIVDQAPEETAEVSAESGENAENADE